MNATKIFTDRLPDGPEECEALYREQLLKNLNLYTDHLNDQNFQSLNRMYRLRIKGWGEEFNIAVATNLAKMGISHRDAVRNCN